MPKFGYFWSKMPYLGILGKDLYKNYCHIWNQHPQIFLFAKIHEKRKLPKFGNRNAWFRYFWAGIWKQYCHIWNQQPRISLIAKFPGKTKMLKFGAKNALFGYFFDQKSFVWVFLGKNFKNAIAIFEISTLEFV